MYLYLLIYPYPSGGIRRLADRPVATSPRDPARFGAGAGHPHLKIVAIGLVQPQRGIACARFHRHAVGTGLDAGRGGAVMPRHEGPLDRLESHERGRRQQADEQGQPEAAGGAGGMVHGVSGLGSVGSDDRENARYSKNGHWNAEQPFVLSNVEA